MPNANKTKHKPKEQMDKIMIAVQIPADMKKLLDKKCDKIDRSASWIIREALKAFLKK